MAKGWREIADYFEGMLARREDDGMRTASAGVMEVVLFIGNSPLGHSLFGWTSVHDLCVQQRDIEPYSGPYLRISPLSSGMIEFRYVDTAIEGRQWSRTELPERTVERLETFLDQVGWTVVSQTGD